jgi:hypothetical protein
LEKKPLDVNEQIRWLMPPPVPRAVEFQVVARLVDTGMWMTHVRVVVPGLLVETALMFRPSVTLSAVIVQTFSKFASPLPRNGCPAAASRNTVAAPAGEATRVIPAMSAVDTLAMSFMSVLPSG